MKIFSDRKRPVHLGPYPLERLKRGTQADLSTVPDMTPLSFHRPEQPESIVNAMGEFQAMMDAIRDGDVNPTRGRIPDTPQERSNHLKAFGYYLDTSMVGIGPVPEIARLRTPRQNPDIPRLAEALKTREIRTLAAGIDVIMADLKASMDRAPRRADHPNAIVFLVEHMRDPRPDERGSDWILNAQDHRACLRATETAVVIANYIRLLGFDAMAHSPMSTDVDLNQLAVSAGLAVAENGELVAPWLGKRFGVAVVTTDMELPHDAPLASMSDQPWHATSGPAWWLGGTGPGKGHVKSALTRDPYAKRDYHMGPQPFERLKRVDDPTTYIDEPNVARVPKRSDMFARSQFGDMGNALQEASKGGHYVRKSGPSFAQRRLLGAFVPLQDGATAKARDPMMQPATPTTCARPAIFSASTPLAPRAARTGAGIPMMPPGPRSTPHMTTPFR